jgi:4-carboxymuconolactone decarboxylase
MRLPFLPPAELSAEQKPLYGEMKVGIAAKYSNFTTMRGDGAILGPWSAWLHDPDLGRALWDTGPILPIPGASSWWSGRSRPSP